jgi:hypothetical protein
LRAKLNDKTSLRTALAGAYAVFAMTNFRGPLSKEIEAQQGKNIADIANVWRTTQERGSFFELAKELDIQHLIWSNLPNAFKVSISL